MAVGLGRVLLRENVEQGQEGALDHMAMSHIPAALVGKHEVIGPARARSAVSTL